VSLFGEVELERMHEAALRILDAVGVEMPHDETRGRLADLGARIETGSNRVRLGHDVVERCLEAAPKSFTLYGRDTARVARFGQGARNYNSIAGEALWVDEPGGERRYCSLDDVAMAARVGDALDCLTIVGAMADPQEIAPRMRAPHALAELLRGTTKPFLFWFYDRASTRVVCDMLIALRGSAEAVRAMPPTYPLLEPISPLRYPRHGVDLLYETCALGLPVAIGPMAQMGVSAPCSIAGTIAQEHAEILAGICVVQAVRPGTPVCYGGICHALDMRTTQMIFAGPEQALFGVGLTEMGKRLGLPVYINVGLTDAKRPDAQAGLEIGVTLAFGAAAGADVFGHLGIAGVDQASSLDMLVLQHEIVRYVESVLRGVSVDDAALALDEIAEVGPGGSFLDRVHTARRFRSELWFPKLLDRWFYEPWREAGAWSLEQVCRDARAGLEAREPAEPLPDDLERELARLLKAASRNLAD
jgi:trimethylamine--corrinoid protein Co-methyltransferase